MTIEEEIIAHSKNEIRHHQKILERYGYSGYTSPCYPSFRDYWAYVSPDGALFPSTIRERLHDAKAALPKAGLRYRNIDPPECCVKRVRVSILSDNN